MQETNKPTQPPNHPCILSRRLWRNVTCSIADEIQATDDPGCDLSAGPLPAAHSGSLRVRVPLPRAARQNHPKAPGSRNQTDGYGARPGEPVTALTDFGEVWVGVDWRG